MSLKDDGGPAFPCQEMATGGMLYRGASLRDYYAAFALAGILSCNRDYKEAEDPEGRVRAAFRYADMALTERTK